MTTYRERIEMVVDELEDIENTIPTTRYKFELEQAIRALESITQKN